MPEESQNKSNDPIPSGSDAFPADGDSPETFPAASQPGSPGSGNRPADGARRASPDEMLSSGFEGSENAGDFLGLDLEFTGAMSDPDPSAAPPMIPPPELELAEPVSTAVPEVPDTDYDAEFDLDSPTQIMHADDDVYDADGEYAEGDDFDDEYGDEFDDAFDDTLEPAASAGRGKLIGAAFVIGLVAFLGVTVGPKYFSKKDGPVPSDDVAANPAPSNDAAPTPANDIDATAADDVASIDPTSSDTAPIELSTGTDDSTGVGTDPFADANDALVAAIGTATQGDPAVDPSGTDATSFEPSALDALIAGDADPSADAVDPSVAASVGMGGTGEFPAFDAGYEWVSPDMLDMVWRGTNVPMEAIAAPARTLMPRVGHVRVHMVSGQTIDGRLYAVGQKRVWLDIQPGRVGLDGTSVERFEHLAVESQANGDPAATSPHPLSGRVSVEVPGGLIYGQVLAQRDGATTLACDGGAKITIKNAVIKPVATNRAMLVQR